MADTVLDITTAPVADTVLDITTAPVRVLLPVTAIVLAKVAAPMCEVVLEKVAVPVTLRLPVIETLAENEALLPITTFVDKELAYTCIDPFTNTAFDEMLITAGVTSVPPLRLPVTTVVFAEKKPFTTVLPVVTDPADVASAVSAFAEIIKAIWLVLSSHVPNDCVFDVLLTAIVIIVYSLITVLAYFLSLLRLL